VPQLGRDSEEVRRINEAMGIWRQGDLALEEHWFTHVADPSQALTPQSGQAEGALQAITSEVEGLVVLTQSCDIVRSCTERPFIEVAPLVKVNQTSLRQIERGLRPAYVFVPTTADMGLVAHLDRTMTVEKGVAAAWKRAPGLRNDVEVRRFAQALVRKRARFAFPDDFTELVSVLQGRLQEKHDKMTPEGATLRALSEIRVAVAPSWYDSNVELFFWFIRNETEPDLGGKTWLDMLESWLGLVQPKGRFTRVDGDIVFLEDLTARDYLESEQLDLDHLSDRRI
jgi:hypothetical protein